MANTTRTQITEEYNHFYDRNLLERIKPALVHTRWSQVRDLPRNAGSMDINFRRYGVLTAATTALSEGVTPSGSQLSITDTEATVAQYGDYITFTDVVLFNTIDPILVENTDILGDQAGLTLDTLARNVYAAGTTIQYASTATANNEITAAMKLTRDEVKEAVRTLHGYSAKPIKSMVNPSDGYNTSPINAAFIGIISEDTLYDLDDATGWIPVEKYANKSNVMPDEVGSLAGVRFVMTSQAYVNASAGSGSVDVHYTLIFGANALGVSRVSGEALQNIIKPLGSGGTADPLNQRQTHGWKATFVAKILQQSHLVVVRHGVTA